MQPYSFHIAFSLSLFLSVSVSHPLRLCLIITQHLPQLKLLHSQFTCIVCFLSNCLLARSLVRTFACMVRLIRFLYRFEFMLSGAWIFSELQSSEWKCKPDYRTNAANGRTANQPTSRIVNIYFDLIIYDCDCDLCSFDCV